VIDRADLLDDIRMELAIAQRTYHAEILLVEVIEEDLVRVCYGGNRALDQVRDRLEAGEASSSDPAMEGGHRWRVVQVGEDEGEEEVLYLAGKGGDGLRPGQTIFLRLFNFIEPLVDILSAEVSRWSVRTDRVMSLLAGDLTADRCPRRDAVAIRELDSSWNSEIGCIWGPPGTGKTWTLGQQVARAAERGRRILVVSTTNDATDIAVAEIMNALRSMNKSVTVKRVGSGLRRSKFKNPHNPRFYHPEVLPVDDPVLVAMIERLESLLLVAKSSEDKATIKKQLIEARQLLNDHATQYVLDESCEVVATTAYTALSRLSGVNCSRKVREIAEYRALFTSLCIDEAGMVSAPVAAALSPFCDTRVSLFGDPKQLAPIAVASSQLRRSSMVALARAGAPWTTLLKRQRRMDPEIRSVVSDYTYDGLLEDGDLAARTSLPLIPAGLRPGTLQVVILDDVLLADGAPIPSTLLKAELGPNRRSYRRQGTAAFLRSLFDRYPLLRQTKGAYICPFRAQVAFVRTAFKDVAPAWQFTTVHAQQGGEAPIVVFDTVDITKAKDWRLEDKEAGISEWHRLLNVAISRGQRSVLLLTTREEWGQTGLSFVRSLREAIEETNETHLASTWRHQEGKLIPASPTEPDPSIRAPRPRPRGSLGARVEETSCARPVLTSEQQRLVSNVSLDGPWYVWGAPGTGKTIAMAEWAVRTQMEHPSTRVGIVYFTTKLGYMIQECVAEAGRRIGRPAVANRVEVLNFHRDILRINQSPDDWQGEYHCATLLPFSTGEFGALFIDEAQDFGPNGLRHLMSRAVKENVRLMLDPMQATGDVGVPDPFALGLSRVAKEYVLQEAHRSTRQIADMAVNLYSLLGGSTERLEHQGLVIPAVQFTVGTRSFQGYWPVRSFPPPTRRLGGKTCFAIG